LQTIQAIGMVMTALLFGMVGFYLTLIAKFYRQKFSKGPPYRWLQVALAVLIAGLVLKLQTFAFMPHYVPSALIIAGGLGFTALCYALYRTMMSVD
jgi:drug/metabolite transporter (DMT)-like permease